MTYTNALQLFAERLNQKHNIKGDSFLTMHKKTLEQIILDEIEEWKYAEPSEELSELCDIMVACTILIERIVRGVSE